MFRKKKGWEKLLRYSETRDLLLASSIYRHIFTGDFIVHLGAKIIDIMQENDLRKNKEYLKLKEILSHNSKYLYHSTLLSIAKLMSNVDEFYMTVFIDWRGRFYSSNCALNIQGGDLARSLLLFKNGEVLTENGVKALKIYTANAYGLDKTSKSQRIEWVDNNIDSIISLDKSLLEAADDPLLFTACAFELKGYLENPDKFISRLPILLDATCNGLQHLSAMVHDMNLAEKVNLLKSNETAAPRDLYSEIIPTIKKDILELVESSEKDSNLKNININRKFVKRGIMTITYGATARGIYDAIKREHFVKTSDSSSENEKNEVICVQAQK